MSSTFRASVVFLLYKVLIAHNIPSLLPQEYIFSWAVLHFKDSLAARWGNVTKFWPMGYEWSSMSNFPVWLLTRRVTPSLATFLPSLGMQM